MTSAARIRTLLLALLAMLTLCVMSAAASEHETHAPKNNKAVAEATGNGDSIIDLAFSVRETASEVINETNTAVAYASCESCRAVAIAFQIVIVQGKPNTVTPQNYAVAVNESCTDCSVLAVAYQFVIGRGQPLEFTEAGLERLAEIREQFAKLEEEFESLTNAQILARTDAFAADIGDILATELVSASSRGDEESADAGRPTDLESREQDSDGDPGTTTSTPSTPSESAPAPTPTQTTPPPTQTTPPPTTTPTQTTPAEDPTTTTTTPTP